MRILYLTTTPSPYKVAFFEELGKKSDLTVVFENKQVSYRESEWLTKKFFNFKAIFLKGINIKDKKISFGLAKLIKKGKFNHIIVGCYSTFAQMIAQQYMINHKINFIHSSDGGMIKNDTFFQKKLKQYFISNASAWFGTGKVTSEYLCYYGARLDKIMTYPFTSVSKRDILKIPDKLEDKINFRKELGMNEKRIIIAVGQFIYRKGMDLLIKVAPDIKETGIYIIGGEATQEYIDLRKKLNAYNVHFIGFKDKKQLSKYYRAADMFVLPTREDIWGLVINEAMAYGLPVITTNKCVAGMEMIRDKVTGTIIPVDDLVALKNAINGWDGHITLDVQKEVLRTAQNYTIENMANIHYKYLKQLEDCSKEG